jgi:hypothetical protein
MVFKHHISSEFMSIKYFQKQKILNFWFTERKVDKTLKM